MNSKAYWNKRFERIKLDAMNRADATVKDVQEVYAYTLQRLQAEVEQWYHRYALENNLSLADARKQLDARDLKAFKLTLKEYQEMAQQEGLSDEHIQMLENASIRVRLDRAQQLYIQMAHHTAMMANELDEDIKKALADVYESSTYKTAFETQRMQGVFRDVPLLSEDSIQKAISKPWTSDGKIFSDRVWDNREQLVSTLQTEISRSLIIGEGTGKLSERIAKRFDVSYHRARALVETEVAHVQEEASHEQYKAHNLEQYEILATLDTKTSHICQSMDGKIIDMKDYKPGITAPPFHPHCRTTTIPYIEGITDDIDDTRAYRDEDGQTQYTDADNDYEKWYNKHIKGEVEKPNIETASYKDIIDYGKHIVEKHDIKSKIGDKKALTEVFSEYRDITQSVPKDMWGKYSRKKNIEKLEDAFKHYPSDWLDYVIKDGRKIYTPNSERGFFFGDGAIATNGKYYETKVGKDYQRGYVTIAMNDWKKSTPFHEIGHMVEHYNKNALRISQEFVAHRTKGEEFVRMMDLFPGYGYRPSEITKADNFISPYIGKEYNGASEVLSVGLESLFEPGNGKAQKVVDGKEVLKKLDDDEEYLHLIVGMYLTV